MKFVFDRVNLKALTKELVALRRDLHRYPESGWTEYRTTVRLLEELETLGVPVRFGEEIHHRVTMYGLPDEKYDRDCYQRALQECGREDLLSKMKGGFTGCVAEIEGAHPGPVVAFRMDIDCNDVGETQDVRHFPVREGFQSLHPNLMHACGHDGHAAIGIGAIRLLLAYRDQIHGTVRIIFQPAEEGLRGAASITNSGALDGVDWIFGGHIGLKLNELGAVAASSRGFLASTKFDVTFKGRAAHAGASPEMGHNALAAASTAVLNLLAIPRHSGGSSRINIGTLHGGTGRNVIPEEAVMTLETRGLTTEINEYMSAAAERVCKSAAAMYECGYESRFMGAAGCAVCDPELVGRVIRSLKTVEGVSRIEEDFDFAGGEDFTTMMSRVQSKGGKATEMVFGCPIKAPHHNGFFDFDEQVIPLAAQAVAKIVLDLCSESDTK